MKKPVIETIQLHKKYGRTLVVNDLSLQIEKGEIYGFLGLNGAGKTTTMRLLLGMIKPDQGTASLFGRKIGSDPSVWRRVGYMVESTHAYPNLSVLENLKLFHCYYGLRDLHSIHRVIELLNLRRYQHTKAMHLSLGNLQRLGLAKALMHEPEVLLLDEPVNGLDPAGIVEIRNLLKELSEQGTTIMISSHLLSEISKMADKIGIIHKGKMIRELEIAQLHRELIRRLIINTRYNAEALSLLQKHRIESRLNEEGEIEVTDSGAISEPESIASLLVTHSHPPGKLFIYEEDLESYFLRMVGSPTKFISDQL